MSHYKSGKFGPSPIPFHVVNRVNNRENFHIPLSLVWELITHELYAVCSLFDAQVHAFVLMANHYHLIMSCPTHSIGEIMKYFGESITRTYNLHSGREGHLFKGRYRKTVIDSSVYYAHAMKYVYRNPVKAGICETVQEYPFSSLHGLLGKNHLPFPVHALDHASLPGSYVPEENGELLEWLNTPYSTENDQLIRKALRRRKFQFPSTLTVGKPFPLDYGIV